MGSGLVKIPVGSIWFYVIKFGIIGAVLGIGVWTWYKAKANNQPPTDYLKLALFVPFTIDFHLHYAFIFLTIILFNKKLLLPWNSLLKPIYLLFIWGFISYVINQFIEFNPLSFLLFVIVFFTPWVFFGLAYKNVNNENINQLLNHYFNILMIMIGIISIQTIVFWNEHPDFRNGGTKDAHFAAIYLSIGFFIVLNKFYNKNHKIVISEFYQNAIIVLTIPILFLIDAKYILIFVLLITAITFLIYAKLPWKYKSIVLTLFFCLITYWFMSTNRALPISATSLTYSTYTYDGIIKHFPQTPKGQLIKNAIALPQNDPLVFIFGSGPGTFLSVAANSRTPKDSLKYMMTYTREYVKTSSKLPIFVEPFTSWIKYKYGQIYFSFNDFGSSIYDWSGSFLNIYFEMGIIGLTLIIFLFWALLKSVKHNARQNKTIVFSLVIFFFLINFVCSWLDQQNFVILQSIFLASLIKF